MCELGLVGHAAARFGNEGLGLALATQLIGTALARSVDVLFAAAGCITGAAVGVARAAARAHRPLQAAPAPRRQSPAQAAALMNLSDPLKEQIAGHLDPASLHSLSLTCSEWRAHSIFGRVRDNLRQSPSLAPIHTETLQLDERGSEFKLSPNAWHAVGGGEGNLVPPLLASLSNNPTSRLQPLRIGHTPFVLTHRDHSEEIVLDVAKNRLDFHDIRGGRRTNLQPRASISADHRLVGKSPCETYALFSRPHQLVVAHARSLAIMGHLQCADEAIECSWKASSRDMKLMVLSRAAHAGTNLGPRFTVGLYNLANPSPAPRRQSWSAFFSEFREAMRFS